MSDLGEDIVGLLDHPLIAPRDCEAWVDGFDAFREHGIGVIADIKFVSIWRQTLQIDGVIDVRYTDASSFRTDRITRLYDFGDDN